MSIDELADASKPGSWLGCDPPNHRAMRHQNVLLARRSLETCPRRNLRIGTIHVTDIENVKDPVGAALGLL